MDIITQTILTDIHSVSIKILIAKTIRFKNKMLKKLYHF